MSTNEDAILNSDRVSLIKFNGRLRRIFSLVQKDSNFAQLKNQFEMLEFDEEETKETATGYFVKALH